MHNPGYGGSMFQVPSSQLSGEPTWNLEHENMPWPDVLVIIFGLVIGSFLNVCIYRLPRHRTVVLSRSRCPHCDTPLKPWENIPLLSFLLLRGRCGTCGGAISWTYPLVEGLSALLFYLLFLKYHFGYPFFVNLVFFAMLVVLSFVDLYERILPDIATLGGLVVGLAVSPLQSNEFFDANTFFFIGLNAPWGVYLQSTLGVVAGAGILWAVAMLYLKIRKIEGMGFGDIKMMGMVGAFLGWRYVWMTIFLGSLIGTLVGSIYIFILGRGARYELPFGTFLGAGAIVATLWGQDLVGWYLSLL